MHSKADQIQDPQHGTGCNDQCSWLQHGAQMVMGCYGWFSSWTNPIDMDDLEVSVF